MNKILFKWRELKATFWFVPVIIILFAVALSMGLVALDGMVNIPRDGITRFFLVKSSDSARSILTTISGAMIGVAGTVFSVTLVALTLASSQFGSRLIRNFMYVRLNQVVLGSYISTYLYCLLILNAVQDREDYSFIPSISILVAILAAVANIILLIVFIHHIATSIQVDNVISDISKFIYKRVEALFPSEMGSEQESKVQINVPGILAQYKYQVFVKSPDNGYLQYVDNEALIKILTKKDALLELYCRPGKHLVKEIKVGCLHCQEEWDQESIKKIQNQLVIGKTKTAQQDLEYSIHQMVEIAVRALSPGINDPYTAITCIDNLKTTMCNLAQVTFPSRHRFDEEGHLRVIVDSIDFQGALDTAFNKIRQYAGGNTSVTIRLMEALAEIYQFTGRETDKAAVLRHAEMVLRVGVDHIKEKNDLDDLKERAHAILG